MNLRNLSIAGRLAGGFIIIAAVVVLLGTLAMREMGGMRDQAREVEQVWMPSIQLVGGFGQDILRIRVLTLRMLLVEQGDRQAVENTIVKLIGDLNSAESAYEKMIVHEQERQAFASFTRQRGEYMQVQSRVARFALGGQDDQALELISEQLNPLADAMVQSLQALERINLEGAAQAGEASRASYASAQQMVIIFIILAALLTVFLAWILTNSIVRPIRQAVEVTERVATGDLTQQITATGKDEPARLLRALAKMQEQLRSTLQGIASSSTQLASAAEELNAVTEDATRGLQRQDDEIQQAATAVNEMSAAVDEVASNAVSTSEQSRATSDTAIEGQQQVVRTVASIDKLSGTIQATATEVQELAEKAQNISRVLDVIRAIAEQTNLLALNAAIEAARAGEQGRGFAVVADEVRALAHRTQQSTSEIEEMIGTIQQGTERSVEAMNMSKTMAGSTLEQADAAGKALEVITAAILQINERNLVIASAAEEQAQVAREVDRNLVNIRDLSTQSAAGAEQTSSSSRELSRLAVDLNDLVNRFKL
ncbi:methyl-accepting chemotaxis protein [Halopseudomonas pelagia]|uniref:Methyl-accepting chemotaxis protein n=1 Tax=Halopseudomonas pelagia TaxID=553151 RepID=A0AA91Z4D6_9GAMM|nr:methyl-accepting chemotaxis protein [Halopseudomonas pelagia]PCC97470.1 methyl-accepting chemotaxis protein [Halopseudomonas pelagia]QFY57785.1 methyl-accepting chemotaxis protein [Halopseudomonas pelagia]